ncbi:ATP-binding cassette domain-containing protein [Roseateles sp. BYS180W]|uniref:ATP-binding cassette domain-containing protein n=1 Tax=Roseateles rivi TaxID=3299028 RepID=A0ABW7FU13_9BURK
MNSNAESCVAEAAPTRQSVPVLQARGVGLRVSAQFALSGVSFSLQRGQALAVRGRNGAGKSTLLRALAGLSPLTQGEVLIAGRPCLDWAHSAPLLGYVAQHKQLPEHLTLRDHVLQQLDLRRAPRALAAELLQQADLTAQASVPVTRLSGGNQRKLHILCALVHRPVLLLADEPCAGLDTEFAQQVRAYLARLKHSWGLAMVLATHDEDDVAALADAVAQLDSGRWQDPTSTRLLNPGSPS